MMTTLTLDARYMNVLQAFGDVENMVKDAVRSYLITRIGERVGGLQHEISAFETRYGLPYEKFYMNVTTDEAFVTQLRQTHPTWERDLNAWEFYVEELHEWLGRLENILKPS